MHALNVAHTTIAVVKEVERAMELHAPIQTRHEAYAVIKEELDEFWDAVKEKHPSPAEMGKELIQVAAMAVRSIVDLQLGESDA